jgi:glyoxylase-like metal-dependent hydrolase (beta-lactamase superfamily II)
LITARPHADYAPDSYRLRPARTTRHLHEGDSIDLGDRTFTVLHLPGHSPGGIALFDQHDGTMFSGDTVYDDVLLDDINGADRTHYQRSLLRLRDLPVRVVHAGHTASFDRTRMRSLIDAYLTPQP